MISDMKAIDSEKAVAIQVEDKAVASHHGTHGIVTPAHLFEKDENGNITGKYLIPRPTNDPRDPLTWSVMTKHLALANISFFVFLSNYITASISPVLYPIVLKFQINFTEASYLITLNILFLGIGNLFWVPIAMKIGKRPALIICSAIFFSACVWNSVATSYSSMLASRIVQGFGASASEALGPCVVADLYFLHERGTKLGFYTSMISGGAALGGIFAGLVANANPDFRWVFWMNSILTGILFITTLVFQRETNFERPSETENGEGVQEAEMEHMATKTFSLRRALSVTTGYNKEASMLYLWWRPFAMLAYPAVWFGSILYGITLAWVLIQATANSTYLPELYNFSQLAVGNISIANLVGAIVGFIVGGPGSDIVVVWITKRRNGYFLPEYRLWTCIPAFIFGPIGLLMWGFGFENDLPAMVAIAGSGICFAVVVAVPSITMTYVVDCYRPMAGETMTILTAIKNTVAFGFSFATIPWITANGFGKVGGFMTLIEILVFMTTIPMYIYGERIRVYTSRFNL